VPIYEYRCPNGHAVEVFQRMTDAPPEACEVCGASPMEKVLFPVAVHFKGSGFYSTDYGRGGRKTAAKDGDGGGTASADSKPAGDAPKKDAGGDKKPAASSES
jgi:putative FmdB family regulatory protein